MIEKAKKEAIRRYNHLLAPAQQIRDYYRGRGAVTHGAESRAREAEETIAAVRLWQRRAAEALAAVQPPTEDEIAAEAAAAIAEANAKCAEIDAEICAAEREYAEAWDALEEEGGGTVYRIVVQVWLEAETRRQSIRQCDPWLYAPPKIKSIRAWRAGDPAAERFDAAVIAQFRARKRAGTKAILAANAPLEAGGAYFGFDADGSRSAAEQRLVESRIEAALRGIPIPK